MFLDVWMKKNKTKVNDLAHLTGWSYLKAYRIANGLTEPCLKDVVEIGYITEGKVMPDDLLARIVAKKNNK
jgi:hypothetical protein